MSQALSPKSPRKGKYVNYRVIFLDDLVHAFPCPVKSNGQVLWDAVIQHLSLLESDYFDLMYQDESGQTCWLDRDKQISKQLANPDVPLTFCVKFYTPDPGLLEDELTRYLFALQIKRDLATGVMPCSENTAALLSSYIAQAEIGDFLVDEYTDHTYLSTMTFVPHQTTQLEQKIMEYHRQHIGESPAEADLNLLDTARKVEMYGIRLHHAKDHEQVSLSLAVAHMGVLVFQTNTKINTFSWAKIRKLSFKRKKFLIKLHPDSYGFYKDTVEFFLETRNDCKAFWKKCIEHHAFFRCQTVRKVPRNRTRVVSRGSSFRYSGRTQKQLVEYVRENIVKRPQFERSTSGRISSRSASVTPKINAKTAIHNSSDIHNSTASSGSHILDPMIDNHVSPTRVEMAEVHSDSSMSGSRSLGSPKLEHGLVISESMDSANHKTDDEMRYEDQVNMKREAEDKGGEIDKLKHTLSNNVDMHIESVNQNANDNDDDLSEDSYHLDDGSEESRAVKLRDVGGKNVTFSDVDGVCIDAKSGKSIKDIIEGKIAEGSCDERSDSGQEVIRSKEGSLDAVEPSECVTASVKDLEKSHSVEVIEDRDKDAQNNNTVLDQNGNSSIESKTNEQNDIPPDDLIGDIPYYLHRRLIEGDKDKSEVSVFTAGDPKGSPSCEGSPNLIMLREKGKMRSPSPGGKPKLANINVRQLKYDHSPSPPSRRSRGLDRGSPSERSPSTHRRLELVHTSKLPPRDSYSSIDDTTSPSFEKEILKQIEGKIVTKSSKQSPQDTGKSEKSAEEEVSHKPDAIAKESHSEESSVNSRSSEIKKGLALLQDTKTPDIDKAIETAENELKSLKTDNSLTAAASSKTERKVVFNIWGQGSASDLNEPSGLDQITKRTKASITSDIVEQNLKNFGKNPEHVAVNKPVLPTVIIESTDDVEEKESQNTEPKVQEDSQEILPPPPPPPSSIPQPVSETDSQPPPIKNIYEVAVPTPEKEQGTSVDPPTPPKKASKPPPPILKKKPPILTKPKRINVQNKTATQPGNQHHEKAPHKHVVIQDSPKTNEPPKSILIQKVNGSSAFKEPTKKEDRTAKTPVATPSEKKESSPSQETVIADHTVIAVKPKVIPKDAKIPVKEKKKEPKKEPKDERPKSVMTTFGVQVESPGPEQHQSYVVESGDKDAWYSVKPDPKQTNVFMEEIPSPKSTNTGGKNIFDLPSPAAAFVYSDDDSPPSKEDEQSPTEIKFSTFRPDPSDSSPVDQQQPPLPNPPPPLRSVRADRDPKQRWSLQKVDEEDESATSPRRASDATKRVSFHGDMRESYISDVSLKVLRSPLDDSSSLEGSHHEDHSGSRDYLQSLENLRNQDSESDMMFSGSSGTDTDSDTDMVHNVNTAKEIYMQYAANKCLAESGRDMTIDSGVGELENRDLSPLDTLEKLKNMEDSFVSEGKIEEEEFPPPPPFLENPSDSSSDTEIIPSMNKRLSVDPLANLEYTDIPEYTTSESESDFEDKCSAVKAITNVRTSTYSNPDDPVQSPDEIEELLSTVEKVSD